MRIRVLARHSSTGADAVRRTGEPLTFGVPMPAGLTKNADGWAMIDGGGVAHPAQARVLERWGDGSLRWALVGLPAFGPAFGSARKRRTRMDTVTLEKRLLDAMERLDGAPPINKTPVALTEGEMRVILQSLTLRTAVRKCTQ